MIEPFKLPVGVFPTPKPLDQVSRLLAERTMSEGNAYSVFEHTARDCSVKELIMLYQILSHHLLDCNGIPYSHD